ncbi:MAG: hypothetical protein ACYCX4_00400 [Bacillota bacterium]
MDSLPQRVIEDILVDKTPVSFQMATTKEGETYLVLLYDKDLEIIAVYPKSPCQDKKHRSQLCEGSYPDCQPFHAGRNSALNSGTGQDAIDTISPTGCKAYYKCAQSVRLISSLPPHAAALLGKAKKQEGK